MKIRFLLMAIIGICLMMGCHDSNKSDSSRVKEQAALDSNISLWGSANVSNYQYTYKAVCFCQIVEDIIVSVVDGEVSEAYYLSSGVYLSEQERNDTYTIDELFVVIQDAIDAKVEKLDVTYNSSSGYPEYISIDYDKMIADDEITYLVKDFHQN